MTDLINQIKSVSCFTLRY